MRSIHVISWNHVLNVHASNRAIRTRGIINYNYRIIIILSLYIVKLNYTLQDFTCYLLPNYAINC